MINCTCSGQTPHPNHNIMIGGVAGAIAGAISVIMIILLLIMLCFIVYLKRYFQVFEKNVDIVQYIVCVTEDKMYHGKKLNT